MYKLMEHTADIGIIVSDKELPGLFSEAARGMTALLFDPNLVDGQLSQEWDIKISQGDMESLLAEWLNKILYEFEVNSFMPRRFNISSLHPLHLKVQVQGEMFDRNRHQLRLALKGVTQHQLKINPCDDGYSVKLFFDV